MTEFKDLAELTRSQLKLKYDSKSVKFLEGFIERTKVNMEKDEWSGLINSCAAFLGECIIENYGGIWKKDENGNIGISFDDKNIAYPFAKVTKQFDNGLGDSIFSFYNVIPQVFGIEQKKKKKWWNF